MLSRAKNYSLNIVDRHSHPTSTNVFQTKDEAKVPGLSVTHVTDSEL